MRMNGPDIVLFAVGALLLGGASFAIATMDGGFSGSGSALGVFTVTWDERTVEVGSANVASMRSATETFDVEATHLAALVVRVECQDAAGALPVAFQLEVTVQGPDGLAGEGSGSCAAGATVEIEVNPAPADTAVRGSTDAEAREALLEGSANATRGAGAWTVTVSGSRGSAPGAIPVGDPAGAIILEARTHEPRLTPVPK